MREKRSENIVGGATKGRLTRPTEDHDGKSGNIGPFLAVHPVVQERYSLVQGTNLLLPSLSVQCSSSACSPVLDFSVDRGPRSSFDCTIISLPPEPPSSLKSRRLWFTHPGYLLGLLLMLPAYRSKSHLYCTSSYRRGRLLGYYGMKPVNKSCRRIRKLAWPELGRCSLPTTIFRLEGRIAAHFPSCARPARFTRGHSCS
jgi:hypothetical protein